MQKGIRERLRAHFLANIGRVMNSTELHEVAGRITDLAQRAQELRTEEGYQILTNINDKKLKQGEYLLLSPVPHPIFAKDITEELRANIVCRNDFNCRRCGVTAGEVDPYDPSQRTRLYFDYIIDKSHGGSDEVRNLDVVCSICHEGAANLTVNRPTVIKLLTQIRRASGTDQLAVFEWLHKKFGT